MSVKSCLTAKLKSGEIAPHRVQDVVDLFDELEADAATRMSPEAATAFADVETRRLIKEQLELSRRQTLLQTQAQLRIQKNLNTYRTTKGDKDYAAAMLAQLGHDDLARGVSSIESRHKAVLGLLHADMAGVLRTFRRTITGGQRDAAKLDNLVREAFGENTGDASARELAQAWAKSAETARTRFNAAGGDIPKRQDWGLPQAHDSVLVRKAGFDNWLEEIRPRLAPERMINPRTGLPLKDADLLDALKHVYDTISTDGWARIKPSGANQGRKLANRRADHRFLVFKSSDDWIAYNQQFGSRDPFSAMVSHLDGMARDIALMEVLGPNPRSTLKWMQQTVEKRANTGPAQNRQKQQNRARSAIRTADNMMAAFDGSASSPVNATGARVMGDVRNVLTGAQLGSAFLSAMSDLALQRMAAKFSGLKTTGTLGKIIKIMGDDATKEQLVRAGLVAENWTENALALQRFQQDFMGGSISRRLADTVLRASGLSPWTQAGRFAFGWEFMGTLADNAAKAFDELPEAIGKALKRYGFDAAAWDEIRKVKAYEHKGVRFLRPEDLADGTSRGEDLATRLLEMIQTETEFAVPTASLRARGALAGASGRPGTVAGEIMRSVTMYKNFAVTIWYTHVRRALNEAQRNGGYAGATYLYDFAISTTLMGAFALQLKEMAKGRDPRPMVGDKSLKFWGASALQGGGLGIFGDFFFSDMNRFGGGLPETIAGPIAGFGGDAINLTFGNLAQLATGEKTNTAREAIRFARDYTPGSNIWYTRLALERSLFDRLNHWADPRAARTAQRRRIRAARKDYGTAYWWAPGQSTPNRAPDVTNALDAQGGSP